MKSWMNAANINKVDHVIEIFNEIENLCTICRKINSFGFSSHEMNEKMLDRFLPGQKVVPTTNPNHVRNLRHLWHRKVSAIGV